MRLAPLFVLATAFLLPAQGAHGQDSTRAEAMLASGDLEGAMRLTEPACRRAEAAACEVVEKAILTPGRAGYNPSRYVQIMSAACLEPDGAKMCGYAALVAAGSSDLATNYRDWSRVDAPGRRGCAQQDTFSCYAMSQLLANEESPYRNYARAIPFARAACQADVLFGCFHLMAAVQGLPEPALGTYADEYVLSFERACALGEQRACPEVPRARTTQQRAARYGAASAMHMLVVDNGFADGNWGGSVIYALEDSGAPAVVEYAVGRVAAAGRMNMIRQQDLPTIIRLLGNSAGAQAARTEMNRRARSDAQVAQRSGGSGSTGWSGGASSSSSSTSSSPPPRPQTCTESYTGGGSGVNGRGQRIVRCN